MKKTFLLGAGFNLDANSLVPPYQAQNLTGQEYEIYEPYPDMQKLASHIFPGEKISNFEERLAQAIEDGDCNRMKEFVRTLIYADHYIAGRLEGNHIYQQFLKYCGPTTFLTFNYDSFLEIQLYKQRLWYPQDGFGVSATVEINPNIEPRPNTSSTSKILHLHGTYLLYCVDFTGTNPRQMISFEKPQFIFDPEGLETYDFFHMLPHLLPMDTNIFKIGSSHPCQISLLFLPKPIYKNAIPQPSRKYDNQIILWPLAIASQSLMKNLMVQY